MNIFKKITFLLPLMAWTATGFIFFKSLAVRIVDTDLWWHLAAGREMVEKHIFLRQDHFSHSYFGSEWINFEWLSQIVLYFFFKLANMPAIYYGKIMLCLAILFVFVKLLEANGARGLGLWAALCCGFLILRPRLYERIELITLLFLSIYTLLLSRARNQPPPQLKKIPWILFGLMIAWCNFHGGYIFGIGVTILFYIGARWSKETDSYISMTGWSVLLVAIGSLINPYGPRLFLVLFEHLTQLHEGMDFIQEWAAPSVSAAPFFWGLFILSGIFVIAGLLARRPECLFWTPSVLVFSVWAGVSQRNVALSVFLLLPFVVDIFSKWEKFHFIRSSEKFRSLGWILALAIVVSQAPLLAKPLPKEKVQWSRFPVGACRFIEATHMAGKMYNSYEFGGYIQWALNGKTLVLMDGRYLFHPVLVKHTQMNKDMYSNPSSRMWVDYLNENKIDFAVANYGDFSLPLSTETALFQRSPLNVMFPRSEWALLYWDDVALVFARRTDAHEPLIKEYEYRMLWPYNLDQMKGLIKTGGILLPVAAAELERHKKQEGFTVIGSELERIISAAARS